jgi:hypothetical protein
MAGNPVLSFLKDKRDINIHFGPVKPAQHINVTAIATVHLSASVSVTHRDASGNILYQSPPETRKPESKKPDTPAVVTSRFMFTDWTGSEDVMTLSQMYLDELQRVIKDGIHKGFLTG